MERYAQEQPRSGAKSGGKIGRFPIMLDGKMFQSDMRVESKSEEC